MDKQELMKIMSVIIEVIASEMKMDAKLKQLEKFGIKDEVLVALKEQLLSGPTGQVAAFTMLIALLSI